ncbi:MAG TPA: NAD+ synthase [Chloroflexota bacterium]|nr:NAD+ synthase [Chloroflexota bacterium]
MRQLRVALAQINSTVGDLSGNANRVIEMIDQARDAGADIVAFPELVITGYPPEDLLLKPRFIRDNRVQLDRVAKATRSIVAIVGFVDSRADILNAAAVIANGKIVGVQHKYFLPNYGVFDEDRYFGAGRGGPLFVVHDVPIGVNICEDMWYPVGPATFQASAGAEVIINVNASPYHVGKHEQRERMLATRAADNRVIVCAVQMVGGQDELVYDGGSVIFDDEGRLVARAPQFEEHLLVADLPIGDVFGARLHDPRRRKESLSHIEGRPELQRVDVALPAPVERAPIESTISPFLAKEAEVYQALVVGTRDYVLKNGFKQVIIGLSGGIDSSLTAAIAADAVGAENVVGVSLPSRYSSPGSRDDARELANMLGIQFLLISIEDMFTAALGSLEKAFAGTEPNIAEENLQARIRGTTWMALSNKFGYLALTAGNKSEMATGYATLYGDMAGGFAVIKDVLKTLVYQLAAYRNGRDEKPVIPEAVLLKAPSAELRPDQRDVDSLPPYEILDPILEAYVEEDRDIDEIAALGFDLETVRRVITMVDRSEYKRRQAPPGIKITTRAFGRDRRLPITNLYRP